MNEQIWLSIDGICNVLQTSRDHIRWLVKNNYLEMIPGPVKGLAGGRFLDPTPEYADRLRTAEMIYQRRQPLPAEIDLSGKALFTRAEIAVLLGWTDSYAQQYLKDHKVESVKLGTTKTGGLRLYTARGVRDLLWRRRGRKLSAQKAPFLVTDLIEWFLRHEIEEADGIPTDAEFVEDQAFQKKLKSILKMGSPHRDAALRDLWGKVSLAQEAAALLRPKAP